MKSETRIVLSRLTALMVFSLVAGCAAGGDAGGGSGGSSGPAGVAGSGGSGGGGGVAATGGSSGTAGGGSGGTTIPGSGGTNGSDASVACDTRTGFTLAIHVVVDVSWPDTIASNGGSGKMHIFNLAKMTANGTSISGTTKPCGSELPPLMLKALVGGGMSQLDVPDAIWDAPNAPNGASVGVISGWNVGSTLSTEATNVLIGLTMPDPNGPWPATHSMVTAVDTEGDGQPGITGVPKSGAGYSQPPVSALLFPKADKVYLVSRTAIALSGSMTSCTEQAGTVTVKFFDNHVVGCHVSGGAECTPAQVDFLDTNRTKLTATGGTFTSKIVPDTATCADARAM